jgi:hypothetical protein
MESPGAGINTYAPAAGVTDTVSFSGTTLRLLQEAAAMKMRSRNIRFTPQK